MEKNEIAYSKSRSLRAGYLWSLNLDYHSVHQYSLNISSKERL